MGVFDGILATLILAGAFWLLYHSLWKRQGHCRGCERSVCDKK
ncbi:MAG: FeoB-associated Cys-rich membrane protein [Deltaproteobacteria bacterium]|nr:FeoB-associated Cys-rich membrane protein [Deltaproteobacteria bacterium]